MQYLIDVTTRTFDLVIVDGPPVMGLADTPLLTRSVKTTVFIVAAGQTRKPALQSALKRLTLARTNIIGMVLTKFDARMGREHGYAYGYGYGYGYGGAGYGQIQHNPVKHNENEPDELAASDTAAVIDETTASEAKKRPPRWVKKITRSFRSS
jgi:Mrp family chromosome partitioning ATPase